MLVSCAGKKKKDTEIVLLLTTMHDEIHVTKDERKKPSPILYYDHLKGEVDVVDLCSTILMTRSKNKRWVFNATLFILDTGRTNPKILYNEINMKKLSNFDFTWKLGKGLVLPYIQQRYHGNTKLSGMSSTLREKMRKVLGIVVLQNPIQQDQLERHGICNQCLCQIYDPGFKAARKKLNSRLTEPCIKCRNFVCNKSAHHQSVCMDCSC